MASDALRPPAELSAAEALKFSQEAPAILRKYSYWNMPWPISLFTTSDDPEKWATLENLMICCLRTGDNNSAFACLEKLRDRFGESNQRVMGLIGMYHEAIAPNNGAIDAILKSYDEEIEDTPTNMTVRKRRVALLKSVARTEEAISALIELLDVSPTDGEAWAELSQLYASKGLYEKAIFCLEEVLLVMPNAWNMHARLGEIVYATVALAPQNEGLALKSLTRAMKSFCRSIELCDDYLRGYYGLKLTTNKLCEVIPLISNNTKRELVDEEFAPPSLEITQKLRELATSKLGEIIRKSATRTPGWEGYEDAEIIAARELLDRDTQKITR